MRVFSAILAFLPLFASSQELVGQDPMNRTVLLEEYAAINCGNCPAGHALADGLLAQHPFNMIAVELHGGGLAVPSSGQPDLRNEWATALWSHYNVLSQPRGSVNRIPVNSQVVMSTSGWANATNNALALPSPVNVGVSSTFDANSRMLTVVVELFYTANGSGGNDHIAVLLKEDHIIGYQQDYVNGAQANYDHKNVLRAYITDLWGDEVTTTTAGSFVQRTYSYTVPEAWNIDNCDVVAFVSEFQEEIYRARAVDANGGTTTGVEDASATISILGSAYPIPASDLVTIPLNDVTSAGIIVLRDATGRIVREERITEGQINLTMNVTDLASGLYHYGLYGSPMKPIVVLH
ncbi:MAG: Omp28-related outer membrane protein [Flavobacteriales bacterium]|nr:Omp28-related outer membrane protein [Flavobacteriales bacterium]